jgi:hypothetical protein
MSAGVRPITIRRADDGKVFLTDPAWPELTEIADALLHAAEPEAMRLRYPYLLIRLANARAVYRVESCERGVWRGTLVEGWVDGARV